MGGLGRRKDRGEVRGMRNGERNAVRELGRRKVREMEGKDRRREKRRTVHTCTESGRDRIRGRKMKHGVKRGEVREGKEGSRR